MKISCVLGFLCNVIVLISPCTAHLIQGNTHVLSQYDGISIVHTVAKGETLSTIATRYYYTFRAQDIIQHINHIPDANLIFPGQQLIIPINNYFLEQHGVQDQLNRTRFLLQKDRATDHLFIGLDVCMKEDRIHKGYCDNLSDDKFVVLQLHEDGRQKLMFHSSYFEEEYWGSGTWDFVDLDGDGNVDLLGEWSQGSVNNTTHIALHFSDDAYRPCQIIDQLVLGDFSTSRDHDHSLIFEYISRYSDERVVIKWNDRMEVCLVDSPRLSFEQIIQATAEPDPLKGLMAFEGLFADPELLESVVTTALANGWTRLLQQL